jgi:membrane protein required for colicin V production
MTPLDWLFIVILSASTIQAFFRGLVLELFSLAGLVCGVVLAAWNYPRISERLSGLITNPAVANIVAFLLIAIGVMIAASLLARIIRSSAHAIGLGFFDRLGGAAFGLVRGGLVVIAILMSLISFLPASSWLKDSRFAPYFLDGAHAVSFVVPQDLRHLIESGEDELKHRAPDWIKLHH